MIETKHRLTVLRGECSYQVLDSHRSTHRLPRMEKKRTLELSQLSLKRENYFNTTREKDLTNETTRRQGSHITRL